MFSFPQCVSYIKKHSKLKFQKKKKRNLPSQWRERCQTHSYLYSLSFHVLGLCLSQLIRISTNAVEHLLGIDVRVFHNPNHDSGYSAMIASFTSFDIDCGVKKKKNQLRQGLLCHPVLLWGASTFSGGVPVRRLWSSTAPPAYHTHPSSCPAWCAAPHTVPCLRLHLPGAEEMWTQAITYHYRDYRAICWEMQTWHEAICADGVFRF